MRTCEIEGCNGKYYAKGLCSRHYYQRPEAKAWRREYQKKYYQRPEVKEKTRKYNQRPEVKERMREYYKKHREEVKAKAREERDRKKYLKYVKLNVAKKEMKECHNAKLEKEIIKFSPKTQKALILDGITLENRMKELKKEG